MGQLIFYWFLFCFFHSFLISLNITDLVKRVFGVERFNRYYRILYVVVSIITIVPVLAYERSLRGEDLIVWNGTLQYVKYVLLFYAVTTFIIACLHYDLFEFVGIKQCLRKVNNNKGFVSTGIHNFVRHPWYGALFVFLWARNLDMSEITTNICLSAYLLIGTYFEERKLINVFGDDYEIYQKNVSMFFPFKWIFR